MTNELERQEHGTDETEDQRCGRDMAVHLAVHLGARGSSPRPSGTGLWYGLLWGSVDGVFIDWVWHDEGGDFLGVKSGPVLEHRSMALATVWIKREAEMDDPQARARFECSLRRNLGRAAPPHVEGDLFERRGGAAMPAAFVYATVASVGVALAALGKCSVLILTGVGNAGSREKRNRHLRDATDEQERCAHPLVSRVRRGNTWGKWVMCRICKFRLSYQETEAAWQLQAAKSVRDERRLPLEHGVPESSSAASTAPIRTTTTTRSGTARPVQMVAPGQVSPSPAEVPTRELCQHMAIQTAQILQASLQPLASFCFFVWARPRITFLCVGVPTPYNGAMFLLLRGPAA